MEPLHPESIVIQRRVCRSVDKRGTSRQLRRQLLGRACVGLSRPRLHEELRCNRDLSALGLKLLGCRRPRVRATQRHKHQPIVRLHLSLLAQTDYGLRSGLNKRLVYVFNF